ncbi:efflux RND transporter periplasmic adaptor subunit [Alkanindiges sp. WGS2144]|uniref:efflux RND transporter periplasmic adaptor subunit n=1 Tax=Alkanindiges sp. WGS2144 TaxID=3366808 RepID=UPI0037523F41
MKTSSQMTKYQMIGIVLAMAVAIVLGWLLLKPAQQAESHAGHQHDENEEAHRQQSAPDAHHGTENHDHEAQHIEVSKTQLQAQHIELATVKTGSIETTVSLPARLVLDTDQQAHISAGFAGRVEQVHVQAGQPVRQGQALVSLWVPELVDLQSNLQTLKAQLALAQSNYQREKQLWQQDISAQQDYLQAQNDYRQAQIAVTAAQTRLKAYGASRNSNGRFVLNAPIGGVISSKDVVAGEMVQASDQLLVIDQLNSLWLEFIVPDELVSRLVINERLNMRLPNSEQNHSAKLLSLTPRADLQTGRLVARARVNNPQLRLRPNMPALVMVKTASAAQSSLVISSQAVQQVEQANVVFVASPASDGVVFAPRPVQLGNKSSDGQWIEVRSGLKSGEQYATRNSFILKSELEKGEAAHEH